MPKILHTELITDNPKATADFVAKMFGWNIQKWDNPKAEYYMWNYPGEKMGGGGIGGVSPNIKPHVDIYVDVEDVNAAIEKAKSYGAKVVTAETEIGDNMGYYAILQVPGGCNLGIWAKERSKQSSQKQTVGKDKSY